MQCRCHDLNNNQIDLANDDAVFSPKQQNENNTHKGINSNLQSEWHTSKPGLGPGLGLEENPDSSKTRTRTKSGLVFKKTRT